MPSNARKANRHTKPLKQTSLLQFTTTLGMSSNKQSHSGSTLRGTSRVKQTVESDTSDDSDAISMKLETSSPSKSSPTNAILSSSPLKRKKPHYVLSSDEDVPSVRAAAEKDVALTRDTVETTDCSDTERLRPRRLVRKDVSGSDDDDVDDELDQDLIIEDRLRPRGKTSNFQKNLERLKRRKIQRQQSSDAEGSMDSDQLDDEVQSSSVVGTAARTSSTDSESDSHTSNNDNFIVEDDGDGFVALPIQFSKDSVQDLAHQFKKVFQCFVHIATQQPENRHKYMKDLLSREEYFSFPLHFARRKVSGLRDSLVVSSVWRHAFKQSLERYPALTLIRMEFGVPSCDACNLGGRMSTMIGRLSGSQYDPLGFEDRLPSSTDSEETEKMEFHLGRFCARRCRVYHQLTHWEYSLFRTICDEINEVYPEQSGSIVVRGRIKDQYLPEDLQDADSVLEWLEERQVILLEWRKLKDIMDGSRKLDATGEGIDDG